MTKPARTSMSRDEAEKAITNALKTTYRDKPDAWKRGYREQYLAGIGNVQTYAKNPFYEESDRNNYLQWLFGSSLGMADLMIANAKRSAIPK
ncbi:MAG: hypothetical protein HY457_00340 [Parcubacteria group bacterium]|nr:hypothetical protein [Parcubacteria group bacterium]